jgi:Do/DeqQ family serine protease
MNQALKTISLATLGGALTLSAYLTFFQEPRQVVIADGNGATPAVTTANRTVLETSDFSAAAELSVNSVVHVNVAVERQASPWEQFFYGGMQQGPQVVEGSGSGVIISEDGYIVTNNHVIAGAKSIKVNLNDNRSFRAELIGADPATDLALLKIEGDAVLQPLYFGNSDEVRLGEWVLAVGNPFNLTSTVTAGIISAKGRNINIINDQTAIEAFIQTDAAVNPGNSGGALVNTRGELIGINTAISTHTGSFEGYSFAVPSNIVRKVVDDLRLYGTVQRAFLGVNIADVSPELAKEQDLKTINGVYVLEAMENGAASESGIKNGDVIIKIDGKEISKSSELTELIGRKRPGDKAAITVYRGSTQKTFEVILRNKQGTTGIVSKEELLSSNSLGATFEELAPNEKKQFGLRGGVKVVDPGSGKLKNAGVPKGFIVVKVNNMFVEKVEDLNTILAKLSPGDGLLLQGYHPNGRADYFAFGL